MSIGRAPNLVTCCFPTLLLPVALNAPCVVVRLTQKSNGYLRDSRVSYDDMYCPTVTRTYSARNNCRLWNLNFNNWRELWWKTQQNNNQWLRFFLSFSPACTWSCFTVFVLRKLPNIEMCNAELQRPRWRGNYRGRARQSIRDPRFQRIPIQHKLIWWSPGGVTQNFPRVHFLLTFSWNQMTFEIKKAGAVCRDNWGFEFLDWRNCRKESRAAAIGRQLFQLIDSLSKVTSWKCSASWGYGDTLNLSEVHNLFKLTKWGNFS